MTIILPARYPSAPWLRDPLWRRARMVPSFDIDANFSATPIDRISGQNLTTFTRAASATYDDVDGVIRTAGANTLRRQWDATNQRWGWLVEEARTNLLLRSEEFNAATWTVSGSSISTNTVASPSGTQSADTLVENTASSEHYTQQVYTTGANAAFSFSVYAKAAGRTDVRLFAVGDRFGGAAQAFRYDLAQGTATNINGTSTGAIQNVGNGWFRCVINMPVTSSTGAITLRIMPQSGANPSYTGDGTSGIYIWGAQLEAGAFPTSYIPTGAATATRDADVWTVTGTNFSRWYRQDQGSVFLEHSTAALGTSVLLIDDTTSSNVATVFNTAVAGAHASTNFVVSGANSGRIDAGGTFSAGATRRTCLAFAPSDRAFSGVGNLPGVSTSPATLPAMSRMVIGGTSIFASLNGSSITRLTYWPARLSNPVLQELTR